MSTQSVNVSACTFPKLLEKEGEKVERNLSLEIEFSSLKALENVFEKDPTHFNQILRVCWALVLRCYTGIDTVSFAYEEEISLGESGFSAHAMDIRTSESLADMLDREKTAVAIDIQDIWKKVNSAMLIRKVVGAGELQKLTRTVVSPECHLRVHVKLLRGSFRIFLDHWTGAISASNGRTIASTFDVVMSQILLHPSRRIDDICYLSTHDKAQMMGWNGSAPERIMRTIHEVISDQVARRPDAEAVHAWDGSMTFASLDRASSILALRLRDRGVGPEVFVPLAFPKSKWNVVAIIGVLKAGGAFIPLDPTHPIARLKSLAQAVNAKIMLCSRESAHALASVTDIVLPLDEQMLSEAVMDGHPDFKSASPDNAAYAIFTSGSTGVPKGTVIEHASFCSGARYHAPALHLSKTQNLRVLAFSSHSFDASLIDMLTVLMVGGCICIPDEETRLNNLAGAINDLRVNWATLTPTVVRFLEPAMVPGLETIVLAGEPMSQSNLDPWSQINLVNAYGPSECSVAACINSHVKADSDPKDIGFPVGISAWVVDSENYNKLLPIGCVGELLAEGPTLARCYLNDDDKTNQVFIHDPEWAVDANGKQRKLRGYLTGDLVRQYPDGSLSFVGRKDTQIKYHGQRIELGEIENNIKKNSSIKHVLVMLPKSGHFQGRLVAMVSLAGFKVSSAAAKPTLLAGGEKKAADVIVSQVRDSLASLIPAYMIPSTWVVVEEISQLVSGKLDRKTMSNWLVNLNERCRQLINPSSPDSVETTAVTDVEQKLRKIICQTLNLRESQVPLDRSFLGIGGDSISAMQMVSMCQKDGIGINVQAILRSKSLRQLAASVQEVKVQSYQEERLGEHFDLSPIQHLWFQLPNQGKGHFNQSFFLQVTRPVSESNARRAVEAIISRHSMLRARFDDIGYGVWQQRVTNDVSGSHRFRTHNIDKKEDATAAVTECQQSLNPYEGPLFGAELFNLRDGKQLIFAVGHHLVIDLVSWRTVLQDFEDLLGNPQAKLLPTTVPFSTWCRLQAEQAPSLKLNEVLPHTNVPLGNFAYWNIPETDNTYGNATSEGFELDCAATSRFLSGVQVSMKADPIDVLLATLIYSWSKVFKDREIPPIYNEGHGREPWNSSIDLSRTVGWFTTVFPVQVAVSESDGMIDVIRRVNEYRKQVPDNGRPYFARRCLTSVGQEYFRTHTRWEMSFNYLGQYQQLERAGALLCSVDNLAGEARGAGGIADVGFDAPRFGLFEVSAVIVQKKLRFSFTFNKYMKHQEMIREWISTSEKSFVAAIENMSQHTPESETNKFSSLGLTADHRERCFNEILPRFGLSVPDLEDAYPCTGIQDGILLSRSRDPGYYSAAVSYEVRCSNGCADVQRLANAWQLVVRRHPVLRTIFVESFSKAGAIYDQLVLKDQQVNIVHLAANSNAEAIQLLESRRSDDFDDGRTPPHRFTIVETKTSTVFCMLEISHAIMDGESINVLFCDLANAYDQRLNQSTRNFGEYVQYLRKLDMGSSIQFWKNYLREAEPTNFPSLKDCNRKIKRQLRSIRFNSDSVDPRRFRDFCSDSGVTMTTVFHAAWAITLGYYVGSEDVCFGYLTSGRDAPTEGIDNMVGPLINTLTCRVKLSKSQTLKNTLEAIQQDYVDSFEHRMVPLGLVQNALELHGSALFNSVLSCRRVKSNKRTGGQETLTFLENGPYYDPTEYPIGINIEVSDSAVALDLEYWTDYISDAHAQNVASTFAHCLKNLLGHSDRALGELSRTSPKHIQQILDWNQTSPEIIHDCLHDVFSKQARLQPDALAIRAFDGNFTYAELDSYSDRLAHYLIELGIGPEIYVPCCFDKSSFTVVAMMGVLKAGGACVALDANHPKEALKTRILDTRASFVLTTSRRAELFEGLVPNVVCVSKELFSQISNLAKPVTSSVRPENPAFVIFTSGSTGKPKGVVLEHRSVVTSMFAHGPKLGIGPGTRFLQFASYTFDVSLEEMFTTLIRGGCCCIPSEEQRMSNIVGAINELEANFIDLTPTVASMIDPDAVPSIEGMAMGGEPLTKAVIEKWCRRVRLHGFYGPSEASINCTWKEFTNDTEPEPGNIGRAIGSHSWIVHPEDVNCLQPIGCKGELLIEGPILARGYLRDREKTEKAFICNPAWACGSEGRFRRFYHTGDLVSYCSNGDLKYHGRIDTQVKLNGQRIELGEIEHHLKLGLPQGSQSAVELVATDGKKALAAFIQLPITEDAAKPGASPLLSVTESFKVLVKAIKASLLNALPSYYVPKLFFPMVKMPMTTSGKLDRRSLRSLANDLSENQTAQYRLSEDGGALPSTPAELALARLWENVLNVKPGTVGKESEFFQLGGDSAAAMRLSMLAREHGMNLSVSAMFRSPTLSQMVIEGVPSPVAIDEPQSSPPALEPLSLIPKNMRDRIIDRMAKECETDLSLIEEVYPCTKLQEGLITLSMQEPGAYVAQTVYKLPTSIDIESFRQAWNVVFEAEPILRTRIVYTEEYGFLQAVVKHQIEWKSVDSLESLTEASRHLPNRQGGVLCTFTIAGEKTSPHFVWTAHHSIYDGWSIGLLLSRVEKALKNGRMQSGKVVHYGHFIRYLSDIDSRASDSFWISRLSDMAAPIFPPLLRSGYQAKASSSATREVGATLPPQCSITMASMIQSAWAALLSTYTSSEQVVFGLTVNGRDADVVGIEDILGPTIATVPVLLDINRNWTIGEFLSQVQRLSAERMPYQHAGLQHIRQLNGETATACGFQNMLMITSESGSETDSGMWNLRSTGAVGTNFFTYPLMVSCTVSGESINIAAQYDPHVISPWLVERILVQFEHTLHQLTSSAMQKAKVGDMLVLNAADQQQINAWNNTPLRTARNTIHESIFSHMLGSSPALQSWDGSFTFSQIDSLTSRVARRLVYSGVKPGDFVPLCFERGALYVVGMLGVLKSGAAFVPLDPEAPESRLRDLIRGVNANLMLCSPRKKSFCEPLGISVLAIDLNMTEHSLISSTALPSVSPEQAAYCIYTSGSTGMPKGTVIQHHAFVSNAIPCADMLYIEPGSRVLQFASYVFDSSLIEILTPLMQGSCVFVPAGEDRLTNLMAYMQKNKIDWACLTPTVAQTMHSSSVPHLKTLVLAGEAMSLHHVSTWAPHVRLINGYGPTETSVAATINSQMTETSSPSNIGYAVGGRCWIVDKNNHDRLQPLGAIGEILVEGPTLALGYLNNPDKTAEVFITSPAWAREAQFQTDPYPRRFYKTGDLAKHNEDGSFSFIGRKDTQVKVRGQRLELGEVEQNLSLDPLVKHVIAAIPASGPGTNRLIAALCMNGSSGNQDKNTFSVDFLHTEDVSSIRDRLCQRLPSYMVPSLWIVFHALPLLPSGKLDRQRVVKSVETMDDETYRKISNAEEEAQDLDLSEVERQFQTIFGQVLNLPENKIGKTKSFLHLGGDSISAMQVQARCKSAGLGVTVQDIIRAKSIEELASKVSSVQELAPQDEATESRFNLSPIQKFFFDTVGDDFVRFNQSGPVLRLSRKFPHEDIEKAASSITKTHSMLRARFDRTAGKIWSQRITNNVSGSYRFRSHQIETSHQIASRTEESQASLNVETGPLWSIDVFDVSEDNSQLLFLVAHHLVIDIVSWHVVLGDLEGMLSGGQQVPQSLPFQVWSGQQEDQALKDFSSTVYPFKRCPTADLEYWGLSQSSNSNGHVSSDCFELEPTHSLLLLGANDALNTEALDIFIASLLESFGRAFTDRIIPPIFNEGHGREPLSASQDLSRTIGWFTTLFPIYLAIDPGEETDILSTIRWVRDFRSRVPQSGRPCFAYSMLQGATDNPFRAHYPMEIVFNYLGKMQQHDRKDALFKPVPDISAGPDVGGNVPRFSIFEISASISRGCVSFTFSFPRDIKHQQKIGTWISECKLSLQQAIDELVRCRPDAETAGFPLLPLAYKGNEKLNQKLRRIGISSPAALEDIFLSSPTQQGILLSQIRNPEHYIFRSIFEVLPASEKKPVDVLRLQSAWSAVVARHQALKTFFIESSAEQGLMDQCVLREHNPGVSIFKCPDRSIPEIFQEHQRLNCRDPTPPHALAIAETSSSRVFCMLEMSHAISDGSSMGVLLEDLASAYDGKLSAKESATQFGEYIKLFYSAERESDLAYWTNYLKDTTPCLFPALTDGIKGPNSQQCLEITFQDPASVNQFCKENAVTVSSLLQLAWAVLLKTYVGSEQVAFGYVTSGRDIPLQGITNAVGCFVRIMICKIDFDDEMSILAGLERVQNDFITAMDHQRSSLADVQHETQQQSLFNTAFTLQRQSAQHTAAEGLRFEVLDAMDPTEYAITLNAEVSNSRIGVSMTYATDMVCPAQATNIAETYQQIVHSIISSDLAQKLGDIEQLGECGLRRIKSWNMNLPQRIDRCIHEIIAEQVHVRPSAQAVCAWDADLSFSELDSLSTNLAYRLQSLGVGLETPVPICFEKSAYAVVAMLGILKAGGAFVPIDGSHPESRLQMLIAELDARLVLCSNAFKEKLLTLANHATVVDEHTLRSLPNRVKPPFTGVTPSNLAYMIYTSGTTGVPKGTMIEHGSFCTSVEDHGPPLGISAEARVLQFANYTFDACVMEIISTLMLGGCVCVPSSKQRMNDLSGAIRSMRVNWAVLTPSVASTIQPQYVPGLKTLVTAGEAQTPSLVSTWGKHCRLINAYGPSETSIIATIGVKSDETGRILNSDCATIGIAVGGRSWLLDPKNIDKLTPIGGVGELVVEGRVVSRGYINNKEKTAASFFDHPVWMNRKLLEPMKAHSDRMYRTGDLCRYNSDGSIVYIGRKDTQIKLNGQRIEVGEIEHHVESNLPTDILSAVDIVSPLNSSRKALCVFFCTTSSMPASSTDAIIANSPDLLLPFGESDRSMAKALESKLASVLPTYMIPTLFVPVRQLPWNASGKLDRNLLKGLIGGISVPGLSPYRLADLSHKRQPSGPAEQALQRAWSAVLGQPLSSIGADDSWFRLGGDSVSSMRLVAAARQEGIIISVADVMKNPKLSDMALKSQFFDGRSSPTRVEAFSLLKPDEPIEQILQECLYSYGVDEQAVQDAYPASPLQQAFITLSEKQPGAYVAQNVFRLAPSIDILQLKRAWQQVVDDLDVLRTRIVQTGTGTFVQVVLKTQEIEWTSSETVESLSDYTLEIPPHNGGPLAAYAIVEEAISGDRFFVWTIHHSVYDGWSMPLILDRLEDIYFEGKSQSPTPPFSSFIEYLGKADPEKSHGFWKSRLLGVTPDHFPPQPRPDEEPNFLEIRHSCPLRKTTGSNITPPTLIRAAWALLLSAYSHSEDVVFGETLSGRDISLENITHLVGPVLTTIPMRFQINRNQSISNFLLNVFQSTLSAIDHQHYGLAQIKRIDEYCSAAGDFQNLLVIQTGEDQGESKLWTPTIADGSSSTFFTYPLVLECTAGPSAVSMVAHYNANVISSFQIQRMLWQLDTLLTQLSDVHAAGTKLKDLNTFSAEDFKSLKEWNAAEPVLIEDTLNSVFSGQVSRRPKAIAISAHDGEFTYAELSNKASNVSNYLRKLGVGPRTFVPVCLDKSKWMMVAILGVAFAGGAYVPLDPQHPVSRHHEIIKDVQASVILCSNQHQHLYSDLPDTTLFEVGESTISSLPSLDRRSTTPYSSRPSPKDPLYVIYTSGSTGRPKGVVIEHQSFCSSALAMCQAYRISEGTRAFHFASLVFDASVMETLTPLSCGATICIPSEAEKLTDVSHAMNNLQVTWAFLTTSVANIITSPDSVPTLETLVVGGEAMTAEIVAKWTFGKTCLINCYGPTEATVTCNANIDVSKKRDPLNIGLAFSSCRLWIVDPKNPNKLSPIGASGELAIEGPILAREYLNDSEKTKAAFFSTLAWMKQMIGNKTDDQRVYLTGDLVRYSPDGSLIYISRKDNQVKINGQRLEIGEIEAHLVNACHGRDALVIFPKKGMCEKRLVAVVSSANSKEAVNLGSTVSCEIASGQDSSSLDPILASTRKALSAKLPPYMVPSVWISLKAIPRMLSGKLDRKKVLGWAEQMSKEIYRTAMGIDHRTGTKDPVNGNALILRRILSQVLHVPEESIDITHSFTSLGGDSISAMAMMARCRKEKITLDMPRILGSKSIEELAQSIGVISEALKTGTLETHEPFLLSPIQRLYFHLNSDQMERAHFNQSFTLKLARKIEAKAIEEAIQKIVSHHPMLRARFIMISNLWHQKTEKKIDSTFRFQCSKVRRISDMADAISRSQASLNISSGPVFSVELFNVADETQVLFMVAHHLVVDMVSWRIILQDLEEWILVGSLLSERPLPFSAWCGLQSDRASQSRVSLPVEIAPPDLNFWGMNGKPNIYGDTDFDDFVVSETLSGYALQGNTALNTEPVDLFIAAILHSFSRTFVTRETPTVYNESHGRDPISGSDVDLSRTVGWFTSLCPIFVPIPEEQDDVINTLKRVKDVRRKMSDKGRDHFASQLLGGRSDIGKEFPVEIVFNYLGKMQQLERNESLFRPLEFNDPKDQKKVSDVGHNTTRIALFEISATVTNGQIHFSFVCNRNMQRQKGIRRWLVEFERTFEELAMSLKQLSTPEATLADFPLLPLESYSRLQKLTQKTLPTSGVSSLANVEDIYPCVPMQEGMLLGQAKDRKAYIFCVLFEMKFTRDGRMVPVDAQKLADAWQKVTDKHPALRTIFIDSVCRGGIFDQVVLKTLLCTTKIIRRAQFDLSALLESGMPTTKPAPPHQLTILSIQDKRVFVKLEMNHAVIDGTSHSILLQDLAAAYEDRLLPGSGSLYSNYVRYIRTEASKDGVSYWTQYLQGIQPCLLPVLERDGNTARKQGTLLVDFDQYSKLLEIGKADKVTLSSMLQGIWARVLALYTHSDDVAFGYVASGRDVPIEGIQDAVGAFINMLVCRVQFKQGFAMQKVFRKVQSDFINALPRQHTSLAQVQHDLGLSGKSLFNTGVSIQNHSEAETIERSGLLFEQIEGYDPSEFALTVNIETAPNCEGVLFRYWTDLVSVANAARLGDLMVQVMNETLDLGATPSVPDARRDVVGDPAVSSQSLVSQLERLVAMSSTQQGNSTDFGSMIRSILDRAVQDAVNKALQSQPTLTVDNHSDIEDQVSEATAVNPIGQNRVEDARITVISGLRQPRADYAHSELGEIVEQSTNISAHESVLSHDGERQDWVSQKLLSLWGEVLDLSEDSIEPNDSFFKLGGDSIVAMKLVGAAREEGLTLNVADVFQNPVFSDMARVCEPSEGSVAENSCAVDAVSREEKRANVKPQTATLVASPVPTMTSDSTGLSSANEFTAKFPDIQRQSNDRPLDPSENDWKPDWKPDWSAHSEGLSAEVKIPSRNGVLKARRQSMREDIYRAFSLLKKTNAEKSIDSFLQESIVPKIQVFRGGIADVLPTTDFQSLAITGSLLESRWMLNYFYLDGEGDLDLRSLRKSAFRIIQAFDILRTVFVPHGDQFLQVVLRKLQPEFIVQETDKDLDNFTHQLHHRDRLYGPRLGESFVQFRVAKKTGTKRHRIFIRISHAQYDGVCMPMILDALREGYQGLPIPSTPSFSNYVRDAAGRVTDDHYDYWRDLLQGSKITEIVKHRKPNYNTSDRETITLRNTIYVDVNCFADSNITPASFIKAAWAFVLAKISATSDVVFGHVISGRNSNVPGISSIVGPCLNTVPVRVPFESHWTVLDLCRLIQSQQIENMPYETLGFREMIKHCTDWPDWTNFSTVIQHQSVKINEKVQLGNNAYKLGAIGSQLDTADMAILSTPKRDGSLELRLSFSSNGAITPELAESVLQMLCQTLFSFSANLHYQLPTPSEISAMTNWTLDSPVKRTKEDMGLGMNAELHGLNREEVLALSDILRSAWQRVLRDEKGRPVVPELHSSFFERGGDVIGLAQVASLLDQEGIKIRVEDLIEHHVMIDQLALIGLSVAEERQRKLHAEADNTPWLQQPPDPPRRGMSMPRLMKSMTFGRKPGKKRV